MSLNFLYEYGIIGAVKSVSARGVRIIGNKNLHFGSFVNVIYNLLWEICKMDEQNVNRFLSIKF